MQYSAEKRIKKISFFEKGIDGKIKE